MFTVDFDLNCLTIEELLQARERLQHEVQATEPQDAQLAHLFEALEHAMDSQTAPPLTSAEKHTIAEALAIDESTGEWDAGA